MKKTPTDVAFMALQSTVCGTGPDRYLIPERLPIVVPRTNYIVPILGDCIRQSEPHGLGVVLWLDSDNWFMSPAFSVDCRLLAAKLGYTRENRVYDSWLQSWLDEDYEPPQQEGRSRSRVYRLAEILGFQG